MSYIFIYFYASLLTISIIGYGFLISRIINKDLLILNIGYQGLFGIFSLTFISYLTIFFMKHNYLHNITIHFMGIFSFIYFFDTKKRYPELIRLFSIFSILFIGLLIIRNHDDFNYYHLTYSLGLTENKIFFGLGQFMHGYKHHSSLFLFNSIIYLPYIKYHLFHSLGWFTLLFINYFLINYLLFEKIKKLDFKYFFYLLVIMFINIKFSRIGGYGTDLSGQIILLSIFPLIYQSLKMQIDDPNFKVNSSVVILLITYSITLKSFFILNFLFFLSLIFLFNFKKIIKHILFTKTFIVSFVMIALMVTVNIAYTGCAVYPVKQTCMDDNLSWSLSKNHVEKMNNHYQLWAKSGFGLSEEEMGMEPEIFIKKFNWVSNWYEKYYKYKVKATIIGIGLIILILFFCFRGGNKETLNKQDKLSISILFFITLVLFFEWFYNHPALRYGGYYLLCIIFFIPISLYLGLKNFNFVNKKNIIISLIIFSFLSFNIRNVIRINKEFRVVPNNDFPFFYAPIQTSQEFIITETLDQSKDSINKGTNAKVYLPNTDSCWVSKTPCIGGGAGNFIVKEKLGFKIFISNRKEIKKLRN